MSFSPVEVDKRPAAADEPPSVYVYGASGRCWKFRNEAMVKHYFLPLCHGEDGMRCILELLEKYGADVGKRIAVALEESPCIAAVDHDFEICITGPDGKEEKSDPRSCIFHFPKANIRIVLPRDFTNRVAAHFALAHLIDAKTAQEDVRYDIIMFAGGGRGSRQSWELACDYLLGDRVVCTEPRPAPPLPPAPAAAPVPEVQAQAAQPRRTGWIGRLFGAGCATSVVPITQPAPPPEPFYTPFTPFMIEITNTD